MDEPAETPPPRGSLALYLLGAVLVGCTVYGALHFIRTGSASLAVQRDTMEAEAARGPRVLVATVARGPESRTLRLLGDAKPYSVATVFAKISGYLKSVSVDKGDAVAAGQAIAEIESAELDAQYRSAVADLDYKQRLAGRQRELLRTGTYSAQTVEQTEASLRMAQEAVRNLDTMRSYQTLRAPFAGTVIARFADAGALMQAATSNQASSLPVVQIADNSRLRVGAYVEQRDVAAIRVGDPAEVIDASRPDRSRTARVSRTAATLDPRTRTLFVEVDLDNADGFLVPGSFTYVVLHVPVASFPQVPVAALTQRGGNAQVAVVGEDALVHFRPVRVAATDGVVVNIAEGVKPGETVALNVPNELTEGARVRPAERR